MKKVTLALVLLVSLSFTAVQIDGIDGTPVKKSSLNLIPTDTLKNDTIVNDEVENIEITEEELSEKVIVSWYGGKFHGRKTASGEKYNMNELTAAHKTLPFGTQVKIKNPKNGKEVIVKITDRGPFIKNREFDLSKAAFEELTSLNSGVLKITYVIL